MIFQVLLSSASALLLVTSATAQTTSPPHAPNAPDLAMTVAAQMAPREQMRGLLLATLSRTTTAAMITQTVGQERASVLLAAEVDKVVERYGDEWTSLLAAAYRGTLSGEELTKAQAAFQAGDRAAMMPLMQRVGPVMQQKATPLLERASKEALMAAYEQTTKEPAR